MKTQDIRNMALALQAVEEASKKKMDPVGREDGDIDNDGDKDKSDSYLHNRRKAISSAVKGKGTKETVTTEALVGNQHKIDANKNGKIDAHDFKLLRKGKKVAEDVEIDEAFKKGDVVKPTKGPHKGVPHEVIHDYGDGNYNIKPKGLSPKQIRYSMGAAKAHQSDLVKEEVEELDELSKETLGSYVKKASRNLAGREYKRGAEKDASTTNLQKSYKRDMGISKAVDKLTKEETSWPVFARIQEKVNQTKGATKPESMEDRFTASDKKMVDGHGGIGKKTPEDYVDDNEIDQNPNQFNAANVKVAPKRHNDQTVGDKTMPKAK